MILGADIGGTTMRVAIGDDNGVIHDVRTADTPSDYEQGMELLTKLAHELESFKLLRSAAVGIAGVLDRDRKALVRSPHLPGWTGQNIEERISRALGVSVHLQNDAALGGLGEAHAGAGADFSIVAYIAVGTGIGGARIVDGSIDRAARGFEIGHQYLSMEHDLDLEQMVSGSAVLRDHGVQASQLSDPAIWDDYARKFAYGLYNTLLHWSPECVVLGGSLFHGAGLKTTDIEKHLRTINHAVPQLPEIRYASLEHPGLTGALIYAGQESTLVI